MKNNIELYNVQTNNLKNISISITKNKITAIYGRSGAGKTSLAFATLYQLCHNEFEAMENGFTDNQIYSLSGYNGIIPSIAITQTNKNNNPYSTIYSFLNISQIISSAKLEKIIPYSFLKLNKPQNQCSYCNGLGEISEVSVKNIIQENVTLLDNPVVIWKNKNGSDLYHKLLLAYCESENIPVNIKFEMLSEIDKQKLLYGESKTKLIVRYKQSGKYKQRRLFYKGIMLSANEKLELASMNDLRRNSICKYCNGSKINLNIYKDVFLYDISFKEFLTLSISELLNRLDKYNNLAYLNKIFHSICEMGLGYLNLSRSIPSLSGGELQKLKFSRILNSSISGVLIVIDEISSQLSKEHYPIILSKLRELSKTNTIVVVEHNEFFIKNADYKIHIGKYAGSSGGYVCQDEEIKPINKPVKHNKAKSFFEFQNINKNNIVEQSIRLPKKCITIFTGVSGSGKSSLAKWIEVEQNAIYISQKNSNFSIKSILATSLKLSNLIAQYYSMNTDYSEDDFLLNKNAGCKVCNGTGVLKYERGFDKDIYINCHYCNGQLFDITSPAVNQKVNGISLLELYQKECSQLASFFPEKTCSSIIQILKTVEELGLGHLALSRKTQTLSGGETRRLKLCEHLSRQKETKKILIIDEPMAGLDPETADKVAYYIYQRCSLFSAVIIIEHRQEMLKYADYEIKIGPYAGNKGGLVLSQEFL